ncbi:MAG TPA: hypothetical protein VLA10_07115, partial [Ilumatobacter sp.]|nr:hypothetical protein [Ilumatobacter sp.]
CCARADLDRATGFDPATGHDRASGHGCRRCDNRPTTVATAAGSPADSASQWERVDPGDEAIPGGMADVVIGGPGFIAVGAVGSVGDLDAAVWTSPDGYLWERVAHDESVFGGIGDQVMRGLAAGGPGFIATGYDTSGNDWDAAVWTSPDGLVWTRLSDVEGVFGGPGRQSADSVVAVDNMVLAVGHHVDDVDQDVAVWMSPDGLAWARVAHDEDVFGGDGNQATAAVTPTESGFVAVGHDVEDFGPAGADYDAAIWQSPDGTNWSRLPHDEAIFGGDGWQGLRTILAAESGLVALGWAEHDGSYDVAVWTSTDGTDWVRATHDEDELGGPGEQMVNDIAEGDLGLVAAGRDAADAAIWISTDGAAWTQLHDEAFGGPGPQEIRGVAVLDDLVVGVGIDWAADEPIPVVWVGRPAG